jgi:hypothetical protein
MLRKTIWLRRQASLYAYDLGVITLRELYDRLEILDLINEESGHDMLASGDGEDNYATRSTPVEA